MTIPNFKYNTDPIGNGIFTQGEEKVCDCCKTKTNIWYGGPFSSVSDIECICPNCIASGEAASKFNGHFIDTACVKLVSDSSKLDELIHRTPSYFGLQQAHWLSHCDDYCTFVGYVGWKELVKMGIHKQIEKNYDQEFNHCSLEFVKKCMCNGGCVQGYLFQCLHCKEYFLYVAGD